MTTHLTFLSDDIVVLKDIYSDNRALKNCPCKVRPSCLSVNKDDLVLDIHFLFPSQTTFRYRDMKIRRELTTHAAAKLTCLDLNCSR